MFGSKRTIPRAATTHIGDWQTALYLISLLAIPVVAAEFSFSTGGLISFQLKVEY